MLGVVLLVSGCSSSANSGESSGGPPNIVFVLTDDLSWDLVQYLPHVQEMQRAGLTFSNFSVTDSLCCPSRSSILTGKYPHNTGVYTNSPPDGGYPAFQKNNNEEKTFATALQARGYKTALMGKYLNLFPVPKGTDKGSPSAALPVPPGWNEWDVAGNGYPEFHYNLDENGRQVHYGKTPEDYLTDVLAGKAETFVNSNAAANNPFMLEVATFAPHAPFTPAPRDADKFPGLRAPEPPSFDKLPQNPPQWLAAQQPLTDQELSKINTDFRKRAQSVQAVDTMIGRLQDTVRAAGKADDTYFVFGSDNGFHMGEYRLASGKMTAFETDVRVPLVVVGPGVPAGATNADATSNIDLSPTFEELGGASPAPEVDGRSLKPLLGSGPAPQDWRTTTLVEHHGPDTSPDDPDEPEKDSGNPPSYEAIRTPVFTYVEYVDGTREYYDRTTDPDELNNVYGTLSQQVKDKLRAQVAGLSKCSGSVSCEKLSR